MVSDFIKQLRSGRHNNQLIETLGGCQHYVSNLKSADIIEQLQEDRDKLDDLLVDAQEEVEQLQASIIHAKWVSAMATIEQLEATLRSTREALRVYAPSNVFAQEKDDG